MPDWISIEEAEEASAYHPEYIRQLLRDGLVAGKKKGGQWWINKTSLLAYKNSAKQSEDKRRGPKPPNN